MRITNFVNQLLGNGRTSNNAPRTLRLGANKAANSIDFGNGITNSFKARYRFPIGKITASGLRATFNNMPGQRAHGQFVEVITTPTKGMNTGAQSNRAVDTAACHHNIGALLKRFSHRKRAQISVDTSHILDRREFGSCKHLGSALSRQRITLVNHVVTHHTGDSEI